MPFTTRRAARTVRSRCAAVVLAVAATGAVVQTSARSAAQDRVEKAATAPPTPVNPAERVTRVYAVDDLLADVPDFAGGPDLSFTPSTSGRSDGGGGGGGGLFGGRPPRQSESPGQNGGGDDLAQMIQSTVAPDAWAAGPDGRPGGTVRLHRGRLIVLQTEAVHRQLADVLAGWRRATAPPVRIRAHWVLVDRADLDPVLKPAAGPAAAVPAAPGNAPPAGPAASPAAAVLAVEPAALDKLPAALAHVRGEIACTSGQRVTVFGVQSRTVVTDVNASVGQNMTSYDPELSVIHHGLVLYAQSTLSDDRRSAVVTLASQWTGNRVEPFSAGPATRPAAAPPQPAEPSSPALLERTSTRVQELRTSVWVPVGKMVLVGGLTLDPVRGVDAGDTADVVPPRGRPPAPQLYLFVEVTAG